MVCNSKLIGGQTGYLGDMNALGFVTGLQENLRYALCCFNGKGLGRNRK